MSENTITVNGFVNPTPVAGFANFLWLLPENASFGNCEGFAKILSCILKLFKAHIPSIDANGVRIHISPDFETPVYFRNFGIILLSSRPERWAQVAYQFSHELCHHAIIQEVAPTLRWLDESIAELASLFFLRALSDDWLLTNYNAKTSDGRLYAPIFKEYAENEEQQFTSFCITDAAEIKSLEADCYDRMRNRYVAKLLLPIFTEHPDTWQAVPYLGGIQQTPLLEAIDTWIRESPAAAHAGLQAIRNLFATPLC